MRCLGHSESENKQRMFLQVENSFYFSLNFMQKNYAIPNYYCVGLYRGIYKWL